MENQGLIDKITSFLDKNPLDIGAMEDLLGLCKVLTDPAEGHKLNKEVRRYNSLALQRRDHTKTAALLNIQKKSLLFDAPVELDS